MAKKDGDNRDLGLEGYQGQPPDQGLSLEQLNEAFAQMLSTGSDPYAAETVEQPAAEEIVVATEHDPSDDACEITPGSIVEAIFFVGTPDNEPLTAERIAGLMRGVRPAEINDLVDELNKQYAANGCPYRIASEGAGYRMVLHEQFAPVRDKLLGRVRFARLSTAAVEVLSLVAYNGVLTSEQVSKLRGTPSGAILSQLVRRQLLAVERPTEKPRTPQYRVTRRFLELFGLESLDDLPRSADLDRQ